MTDPFGLDDRDPERLARIAALRAEREERGMTFRLEGVELKAGNAFENEHDAMHGTYAGAIGGRYSYTFTGTSIGTAVCVSCAHCEEELDITDYDAW